MLLLLLFIGRKRGTLHYPTVEFEGTAINPSSVEHAVRRTDEFFRNRVAYGSLYVQYEAQFWWCVHGGAPACRRRAVVPRGRAPPAAAFLLPRSRPSPSFPTHGQV